MFLNTLIQAIAPKKVKPVNILDTNHKDSIIEPDTNQYFSPFDFGFAVGQFVTIDLFNQTWVGIISDINAKELTVKDLATNDSISFTGNAIAFRAWLGKPLIKSVTHFGQKRSTKVDYSLVPDRSFDLVPFYYPDYSKQYVDKNKAYWLERSHLIFGGYNEIR